jgi:D-beta-D-heptose 7-phosphate kinase/D-beta-D-heptose 1-phosphate adenosyltransferase
VLAELHEYLADAEAIVISDYRKGVVEETLIRAAIRLARLERIPVIGNIKPATLSTNMRFDAITLNINEASELAGEDVRDNLETTARHILNFTAAKGVVITLGAEGCYVFDQDADHIHIPGRTVAVADTCGAGDTFTTALALALANGAGLDEAAQLANMAASVVVQKQGTATVGIDEIIGTFR